MFQITRNYNHPVTTKGIKKHCKLLNLADINELKLIFVVPKGMDDYKKQDLMSKDDIFSNISTIPGIGPIGTEQLYSRNIKTVEDLKNAIESPNYEELKILLPFKRRLEESFLKSLDTTCIDCQHIPQYVLEL